MTTDTEGFVISPAPPLRSNANPWPVPTRDVGPMDFASLPNVVQGQTWHRTDSVEIVNGSHVVSELLRNGNGADFANEMVGGTATGSVVRIGPVKWRRLT